VRLLDAALQALCARAPRWKHPRRSCCGSGGECDWAAAVAVAVARREMWQEEAREDDGAAMLMLLGSGGGGGSVRGPGVLQFL
jgi:hypothetical protein